METPRIPSKSFSALSGSEIIEIFCRQLRDALEGHDDFSSHLTFPVVEATWHLEFRSYPGRNSTTPLIVDVPLKAEGKGEMPPLQSPITGEKKGELITDAPDEVRVKYGMPVTRPEMVNGRFIDRAVIEKPLPEIPRMED
jgi:hypothetical protein